VTAPAPRVVALVGATATGKTALGEALAAELDGEVVCADSRQVFRELEIGTGKPTPGARAARPHHLFDALGLGEAASAGWYARAAREACACIHAGGRVPVLVGGSGLYLRAARSGLAPTPPADAGVRERLRGELAAEGLEALRARLAALDPEAATRLAPGDAQRTLRALEVALASGRSLSWWHRQERAPAVAGEWRAIEIVVSPRELGRRIAGRTQWMFDRGLVEETRALLAGGSGQALRALRAVGYDEAIALIEGRLSRPAAEERTNQRTRQLAKRQRTWFRHQAAAVRIDGERPDLEAMLAAARGALRG
jgi:tRNA dimethylallyltransferase